MAEQQGKEPQSHTVADIRPSGDQTLYESNKEPG